MPASRSGRGFKPILWVLGVLITLVLGLRTWQILDARPKTITLPATSQSEDVPLLQKPHLSLDPVIGHRPRENYAMQLQAGVLGTAQTYGFMRKQDRFGLISADPLPSELTPPRILIVGDLNLMGLVPAEDNLSSLIQRALRGQEELETAVVLNAGCEGYSLYQSARRAASLAATLQPQLLVAVISTGDDFLELQDQKRPHVDDILLPQPPSQRKIPDASSNRRSKLGLPDNGLFWTGMNQAAWMSMNNQALDRLEAKTAYCLNLIALTASRQRAAALIVLLPSSDLLFPDLIASSGSKYAKEIIDSGVQAEWYQRVRKRIENEGLAYVDLEPAFRRYGQKDLYTQNHELGSAGHGIAARVLSERIAGLLLSRSRTR